MTTLRIPESASDVAPDALFAGLGDALRDIDGRCA